MLRKNDYEALEICNECDADCHAECINKSLSEYDTPVCGCHRCLK